MSVYFLGKLLFQSTPSVGRATKEKFQPDIFLYISIHALRGEGDTMVAEPVRIGTIISIHALRGEGDNNRGQTFHRSVQISIHALRGEGDIKNRFSYTLTGHFNPRPPWGGRLKLSHSVHLHVDFNPRPPWGGRPFSFLPFFVVYGDFNPRPPWGGRPCNHGRRFVKKTISIHALHGEGDVKDATAAYADYISIHALRGEGDRHRLQELAQKKFISIHALRGEGDAVRVHRV